MSDVSPGGRIHQIVGALVTIAACAWSFSVWSDVIGRPDPVCVAGTTDQHFEKAIGALDGNIDLGLKLAVALLGGGSALLIGLKEGLRQTFWTRLTLIIGMLFFAQSALYGLWWRIGIGEGWLEECLNIVTEKSIAMRYVADMNFFLAGLFVLTAFVVIGASSNGKTLEGPAPQRTEDGPAVTATTPSPIDFLPLLVLYGLLRFLRRSK